MATEITMFREVLDRVNALVEEVWEYKEQNSQLDARRQRQEESLKNLQTWKLGGDKLRSVWSLSSNSTSPTGNPVC